MMRGTDGGIGVIGVGTLDGGYGIGAGDGIGGGFRGGGFGSPIGSPGSEGLAGTRYTGPGEGPPGRLKAVPPTMEEVVNAGTPSRDI